MATTVKKPKSQATPQSAGPKRSFQESKARVLKKYAPALAKLAK